MNRYAYAAAAALTLTALCINTSPVFGQMKMLSTEELTRRADVVAVGQVASLSSEWNETHSAIRTRVVLSVSQYVKGTGEGGSLTVYVPGGEVGTVGEIYSHMPVFHRDEDVVVFAEKDRQNRYRVCAGQQGKFVVKTDAATGVKLVAGRRTLQEFTAEIKRAEVQQITR